MMVARWLLARFLSRRTLALGVVLWLCLVAWAPMGMADVVLTQYRNWATGMGEDAGITACYVFSRPLSMEGNYTRRGSVGAFVTSFSDNRPSLEVSITMGYPVKTGVPVTVTIDGRSFQMISFESYPEEVFALREEEADMIKAMRAGHKMEVRGVSRRGTETFDTYSLLGVTLALENLMQDCDQAG